MDLAPSGRPSCPVRIRASLAPVCVGLGSSGSCPVGAGNLLLPGLWPSASATLLGSGSDLRTLLDLSGRGPRLGARGWLSGSELVGPVWACRFCRCPVLTVHLVRFVAGSMVRIRTGRPLVGVPVLQVSGDHVASGSTLCSYVRSGQTFGCAWI